MTWKEFKEKVESQGVKDDDEICWIEIDGDQIPKVDLYPGGIITISGDFPPDEDEDQPNGE